MTRVERKQLELRDAIIHASNVLSVLTPYTLDNSDENHLAFVEQYKNIAKVLPLLIQDYEAYRILNDIRTEKLYLIDSNGGKIVHVHFA